MAITLTQAAAEQVKTHLAVRAVGTGLRLGVTKAGCSGMGYQLEYAEEAGEGEQVFVSRGVTVVVETGDLVFLEGTEIDYVQEGLSAMFQFRNPNVTEQCGCGESFTVNQREEETL